MDECFTVVTFQIAIIYLNIQYVVNEDKSVVILIIASRGHWTLPTKYQSSFQIKMQVKILSDENVGFFCITFFFFFFVSFCSINMAFFGLMKIQCSALLSHSLFWCFSPINWLLYLLRHTQSHISFCHISQYQSTYTEPLKFGKINCQP